MLAADTAAQEVRRAQTREEVAPRQGGEPIMAIVSIKSQQVTFYDADGRILRAPVSTGTTEYETPAGVFAIVQKKKDHRSNMYDDAWMPHMQRITWNGIALHGGPLPGYAASHGCIRMPFGFADKLFTKTRIGMRVIISPNDAGPVELSHPALFMPRADVVAAAPARAETLARESVEAAKAADAAKKAAARAPRETASLTASLRKLEQLKARADAELASADKALAAAKTDEAKVQAEERKQKAAAKAAEAGKLLDTAKADTKPKLDAVAATKDAVKAAETRKAATADTLFRIGSTSKAFVSLSVLKLVEEGKMTLDDTVKKWAPEVEFTNRWESTDPVRIIHLLEHTSGFDDIALREYAHNDPTPVSLKDALAFNPKTRTSRWRPGTRMSYCNSGPAVAAYVVQKVSGQIFEDYVRENFFKPLHNDLGFFFLGL
jgi:hypothetical protein